MRGGSKYNGFTIMGVLLVLFWAVAAHGAPFSFTGIGTYQHTDEEGDTSNFNQSTTLDFEEQLTPLMSLEETVRYTTGYREENDTEAITPSLGAEIINDIFHFDLSGTANQLRNSERSDLQSNSWLGRWQSNWQKELWPALQINWGGSRNRDDETPSRIDSRTTFEGFNIDWDLLLAKIYYNIDLNKSDNYVDNSDDKSTNQLVRLTTDKSLWQDRVTVAFLGQYSKYTQDFTAKIERGSALVPIRITDRRGLADNRTDPQPRWSDLLSIMPQVIHDKRYNLGIEVDQQQVNTIYLYTASGNDDLSGVANLFHWSVYYSNDPQGVWTHLADNVPTVYNNILQRFELQIPEVRARYIMLVETDIPTTFDFNISDIQAFTRVVGQAGQKITSETDIYDYKGDTNISYRILPDLRLTYNLILETGQSALGNDTDRSYNAASIIWSPSQFFSPTFTASQSREDLGIGDEEMTRFYAFNISSQLLPTLDMNIGVTRSDTYEADEATESSYNYNLFLTALIFPDLTSNLDVTYINNTDEEDDSVSQDFNSTLKFTARLNPELTVDLTERYTTIDSDTRSNTRVFAVSSTGESGYASATLINASWRPSDIFSLQGGGGREWETDESSPYTYYFSLTVAPTYKTQVNLSYDHSEGTDDYNASYNWIINQIFSLRAYCMYIEEEERQFAYGGQLVIRY